MTRATSDASTSERAVELSARESTSLTVHILEPLSVSGVVILFPGADGKLRNYGPPDLRQGNFLVRSRALFVARGFVSIVMDAPSDQPDGMWEFRTRPEHRADIARVIAYAREKYRVPVWLVGTSRGSISAANGATLTDGAADGVVLTSSVTREGLGETGTLLDVDLAAIGIPVLLTHHVRDGCVLCPFADTPEVLESLRSSPRRELMAFAGGDPEVSDPCKALSHHGYLGIEPQVVNAICDWIRGTSSRTK
ncbi:MAG: alpha/beta hydrolase [Gammaproteobacteria bacterium]